MKHGMQNYEYEHIVVVAERNAEKYRKNKKLFHRYMQYCGWTKNEIDLMVKLIVKGGE